MPTDCFRRRRNGQRDGSCDPGLYLSRLSGARCNRRRGFGQGRVAEELDRSLSHEIRYNLISDGSLGPEMRLIVRNAGP
jgi:hypothetical protein